MSTASIWALTIAFVIVLAVINSYVFALVGGWRALAKRYRNSQPPGTKYNPFWSAFRHPAFSYRQCLYLFVGEDGLGFKVTGLFRLFNPTLFIPWYDIHYEGDRKYFMATISKFSLGSPPLTALFLWKGQLSEQLQALVKASPEPMQPTPFYAASGRGQMAFIFALLSFFCFGPLTGIPAVILGLKEVIAIDRGEASPNGRKTARAAWILGIVGMIFWFGIVVGLSMLETHSSVH